MDAGEKAGFVGEMAEVRLWNTQRSEAEIASSWNKPASARAEANHGLVACWAMRGSGDFFIVDETHRAHAALAGEEHLPFLGLACVTDCNAEGRCVPQARGRLLARQAGLPDLTIDAGRAQSTMYIQQRSFLATDCAVNEGCTGAGARVLLRFDTGTFSGRSVECK